MPGQRDGRSGSCPMTSAESRCVQFSCCHPAIPGLGWAVSQARGLSQPMAALRRQDRQVRGPCHGFPAETETGTAEPILTVTPRPHPRFLPCPGLEPPDAVLPLSAGGRCSPGGASAPRYLPSQPGRSPPAKLPTAIDLRCTSDLPGSDLAQASATTTAAHPILPRTGRLTGRCSIVAAVLVARPGQHHRATGPH